MAAEPQEDQYNADVFETRGVGDVKQRAVQKEMPKAGKLKPDRSEDVVEY